MHHLAGRRDARLLAAVLAVAFVASACGSGSGSVAGGPTTVPVQTQPAPLFPMTMTDDDGVSVTIPAKPTRIVTFAPSNTEIVFALGLGDELVGVSGSFDNYPPAATSIEQVGGSGEFGVDPNVEKVVALRPDLMLTISGGDQWKERLRDLDIPVFTINATDFDDLLRDIRTVGAITGAQDQADALVRQMSDRAAAVEPSGPPVSCFFEAYYPPLTTIGPHTFIFDLLKRAGCDPVSAEATSDYPEWSVDSLVAEGPSVYLVASESGVPPEAVTKRPGFSAIEAVEQGKVFLVDSDLIRPGPRVIDGLESLVQILHP
jgi:iron complex transport system substrate-binding protein